jgi:hypothetical protein
VLSNFLLFFSTVAQHRSIAITYVPVPAKGATCGLPPPLSVTETSAVRLPLANGVNVTVIEQLAPDATLVPHVLDSAKSASSAPVTKMLVMPTAVLPLLLSVIFLGVLLVSRG